MMPHWASVDIVIGFPQKVSHKILHIPADIACFTEFGGIALHEGHTELLGDQLDHVGFADTGRADHQHVVLDAAHELFLILRVGLGMLDSVEVGADFCGEDGFGPILPDDKLVQISNQLFGLEVESDPPLFFFRGIFFRGESPAACSRVR